MQVDLSVIIVNYNGLRHLKGCFDAIAAHAHDIAHEVVVVDNNSADGSCDYIKANYPNVVLIESRDNLGFGGGNNLGVKSARGEYLLLLNNDTILLSDLKPVLEFLRQHNDIGAVGINMLNGDRKYLKPAGKFPAPSNLYRIKNMFMMGPEFRSGVFSQQEYSVDWLSGSFLMMPKKVYDKVGGFDEDYFMYVEDVDICRKIANAGYKRVFLPDFSYIHFVGHNTSRDNLLIEGCSLYINKHMTGLTRLLAITALEINKTVKRLKKLVA